MDGLMRQAPGVGRQSSSVNRQASSVMRDLLFAAVVALLTVFAVAPLTYPGFLETQSGFLPAWNAAHLGDAPDWGLPAGTADPIRGEGKLPYLLIWPFYQLAGSGMVAVKWGYGLAFVLGALGVYAWARNWLGLEGAVLAATVYTYLPWHLSTVYLRGAYAEAWLWAFVPLGLWAMDRWGQRRLLPAALAGLVALAAMLWSQAGLALLFLPLWAAYAVTTQVGWRHAASKEWPLAALAVGLLVPWLVGRFAPGARILFTQHLLFPYQLFSAAWDNDLSFQLGLVAVGLSVVAVALWVSKKRERAGGLGFWAIALLVVVLLTMPPLGFVLKITGLATLLTYPWQLLALAGLPLAFLAGSAIRADERLAVAPVWAGMVALAVLGSYFYLAPQFTQVDPGPEPVAMFQPVGADRPQIMMLDYQIRPASAPAAITPTLTLTVTWQAVEQVAGDYTVFAHLLAADETKLAQRDTRPCDGQCPTDTWQPGQIVVDAYQLSLAPDAPPGPYHLDMGLYLLDTGERAAVAGRDDKTVILDVP
jgi:hypothetical protein